MIKVYSASYAEIEKTWSPYIGDIFTVVCCDTRKPRKVLDARYSNYLIIPDKDLLARYRKGKIDYETFSSRYLQSLSTAVNQQCLYHDLHSIAYGNHTDIIVIADDFEKAEQSTRQIIGKYLGKPYCGELH